MVSNGRNHVRKPSPDSNFSDAPVFDVARDSSDDFSPDRGPTTQRTRQLRDGTNHDPTISGQWLAASLFDVWALFPTLRSTYALFGGATLDNLYRIDRQRRLRDAILLRTDGATPR